VRVVFDPSKTKYETLLGSFWEGHDPTVAAAAAHRSAIYWSTETQRRAAEQSRDAYQSALSAAGKGRIATEIAPVTEFGLADDSEQQFLAKNPGAHAPSSWTGVRYPKGSG
jgi:peptide-methionine (S)-S-oxide reductase